MQAPDLFASLVPQSSPAQGLGGGVGASAQTQGEGTGDTSGFAEALMAAMVVVQPQLQQQPQAAPTEGEGEGAAAIDTGVRAAPAAFASTLLAQTPADAAATVATAADAAALVVDPDAAAVPAQASAKLAKALDAANLTAPPAAPNAAPDAKAATAALAANAMAAAVPVQAPAQIQAAKPAAPGVAAAVVAAAAAVATDAADTPPPVEPTAPPPVAAQQAVISTQAAQVAPPRAPHDPAKVAAKAKLEAAAPHAITATHVAGRAPDADAVVETVAAASVINAPDTPGAVVTAQSDGAPVLDSPDQVQAGFAQALAHAGDDAALAPDAPKVTSHTIDQLSAQISKSLEGGRTTRFDVQLEPYGLGKVDVRVEINRAGEITADLRFDNPVSAAELRSRSGELAIALQDAGFDPSKTQLSFSSNNNQNLAGGQGGQNLWSQQQQQDQGGRQAFGGRAFIDLSDTPETAAAHAAKTARTGGVDVRI